MFGTYALGAATSDSNRPVQIAGAGGSGPMAEADIGGFDYLNLGYLTGDSANSEIPDDKVAVYLRCVDGEYIMLAKPWVARKSPSAIREVGGGGGGSVWDVNDAGDLVPDDDQAIDVPSVTTALQLIGRHWFW